MRSSLIVLSLPHLQNSLRVCQIVKPVHIRALVPQCAVELLDHGVVGRLSRPGILHHHAVGAGPEVDQTAGKPTSVGAVDPLRFATFGGNPAENGDPIGTPRLWPGSIAGHSRVKVSTTVSARGLVRSDCRLGAVAGRQECRGPVRDGADHA